MPDSDTANGDAPIVVRLDDLKPFWGTSHATEPGFLRWLVTYVGPPEGNPNPESGAVSERVILGLMRLYAGNRQYGVHTHTVTEVYLILRGEVESIEPGGIRHVAGPMDCLYIPPGAPHGVRAIGDEDVDLVWIWDGLEPAGGSTYYEDDELEGDFPRVTKVRWQDLEPQWVTEKAKEGGHMRWNVSWVGGEEGMAHLNREAGVISDKIAIGAMVLLRNNTQISHSHPITEMYVIAEGECKLNEHPEIPPLGPLDALILPPGVDHGVRAVGDKDLRLIWLHDQLLRMDGTLPD
jgi:mannose-6-phosphate isomerase-like protein (cupin superfamily)